MPKGDKEILKADPEDGTTPIANLLLEALAIAKLTGKEKGIILHLWRRTYGWERKDGTRLKEKAIALGEFGVVCNSDSATTSRLLAGLVKKNILKRDFAGPGKGYTYSMNTRVGEWDKGCINHQLLKIISIQPLVKMTTQLLVKMTTPSDTKLATPKEKLNKYKQSVPSKDSTHKPKVSNHPLIAQMQKYLGFPEKTNKDPIPNPAKEARFIKRMLSRGFTDEDIFTCWKSKVDQRGGESVSMVWVNEDIGKKEFRRAAETESPDVVAYRTKLD